MSKHRIQMENVEGRLIWCVNCRHNFFHLAANIGIVVGILVCASLIDYLWSGDIFRGKRHALCPVQFLLPQLPSAVVIFTRYLTELFVCMFFAMLGLHCCVIC